MNYSILKNWLRSKLTITKRLEDVCISYIFFLMVLTRKHSLEEAAKFGNLNKSQFTRFLKNHCKVAVYTLDDLSKGQAKKFSKVIRKLNKNTLPWKVAIIFDSTIQHRSSLHPDNSKKFNHGKGYVIGHQWTNIVLIINDMLIPLPPIPFHSKNYCRKNNLKYRTEHDLVIEFINNLDLESYIGPHKSKEVLVLADSGYDDKKIENAIILREWKFIIALKSHRSVKTKKQYAKTSKSTGWSHISVLFKSQRIVKWITIRIFTNGGKNKRMDFRIRQIIGYLRYVGKVQLICSEFKKRRNGRRKYLACNDLKVTARQILIGYRLRWAIEIFHKEVKMFLGFEEVATKWFASVSAHVHWVYCAYILLNSHPPGVPEHIKTLREKQSKIMDIIKSKEISETLNKITQIDGVRKYKDELKAALQPTL